VFDWRDVVSRGMSLDLHRDRWSSSAPKPEEAAHVKFLKSRSRVSNVCRRSFLEGVDSGVSLLSSVDEIKGKWLHQERLHYCG